ncbi:MULTISPECIES: PotD/PotF family extracellular solute-binding protein [unclassified Achromobacter]|uniref:ABC transporter substrate-binding protein n=1 Tax=unclassified Achromobacter TaxID=2626865 RepID=UPI000B51C1B1|nr:MULTISPECIES: extracellular solute-binding protein [unclassified Achromobacter]OWT77349.1 ABC transporter substrate-binding protein [Achromobacter sp. HZ28]OWT78230.1 ABC transporter substrate-binding protein [Achromobacter sp. HZ34]
MNRREFLTATAALSLLGPKAAMAASQVVVGTWGGELGQAMRDSIDGPLMGPQGIEVLQAVSAASARRTKVLAERNSRRGSMDVAHLADYDLFAVAEQNALESINTENVSNAGHVLPFLRRPYGIPQIYSAYAIIYNKDRIKVPPQSFADLWDPKWKGKFGISDNFFLTMAVISAMVGGGSMKDFAPATSKLRELKKQDIKLWPATDAVGQALKSEDILITVNSIARAYSWRQAGLPVGIVFPSEGSYVTSYDAGVPRNARNKAAGFSYLNAMLDPAAQVEVASKTGYLPTVDNARLPESLSREISLTPEQIAKLWPLDFAYMASQHAAMFDFWTREIRG